MQIVLTVFPAPLPYLLPAIKLPQLDHYHVIKSFVAQLTSIQYPKMNHSPQRKRKCKEKEKPMM